MIHHYHTEEEHLFIYTSTLYMYIQVYIPTPPTLRFTHKYNMTVAAVAAGIQSQLPSPHWSETTTPLLSPLYQALWNPDPEFHSNPEYLQR